MGSKLRAHTIDRVIFHAGGSMRSKQLIQSDWQARDAFTGRVINRVGDGRSRSRDSDFPNSVSAEWGAGIGSVRVQNLDVRDIGLYGDVIFGERGIDDAPGTIVEHGFLGQCHTDAHDDAATELRNCRFWIQDASSIEGS